MSNRDSPIKESIVLPRQSSDGAATLRDLPRKPIFTEVLVCSSCDEQIQAMHLRRRRSRLSLSSAMIENRQDADRLRKQLSRKCAVITLLPRSSYLLRTVRLPKVEPNELEAMLQLEVETTLPPEFKEIEVAYRKIDSEEAGYDRFETYIAKSQAIEQHAQPLRELGLEPDFILPSAVIWHTLLDGNDSFHMMVASSQTGTSETASVAPDRTMSVRTVDISGKAVTPAGINRDLLESVRALMGQSRESTNEMVVGWVGNGCPSDSSISPIRFEDISEEYFGQPMVQLNGLANNPILTVSARSLLTLTSASVLQSANLIPASVTQRQLAASIYKKMAASAVMVFMSILLIYIALQVGIIRNEEKLNELLNQIQTVKVEGEAVGRRIAQLEVIGETRLSRHDFYDVLKALHAATPKGITYSHVDLSEDGILRLRGQAESLSLPFLLPQKLEEEAVFKNVLLRDAGQAKRGRGTVTEFRLECQLHRRAGR